MQPELSERDKLLQSMLTESPEWLALEAYLRARRAVIADNCLADDVTWEKIKELRGKAKMATELLNLGAERRKQGGTQ